MNARQRRKQRQKQTLTITEIDYETKTITVRALPRHKTSKKPNDHESLLNFDSCEPQEFKMRKGKLVPA